MSFNSAQFVSRDTTPPQIAVMVSARRNGGLQPNVILKLRAGISAADVKAITDLLNGNVEGLDLMLGM